MKKSKIDRIIPFEIWYARLGRRSSSSRTLFEAMATREEELQKKREEAERKARRGEIDPTHEFTIQVSW